MFKGNEIKLTLQKKTAKKTSTNPRIEPRTAATTTHVFDAASTDGKLVAEAVVAVQTKEAVWIGLTVVSVEVLVVDPGLDGRELWRSCKIKGKAFIGVRESQ